MKAAQIDKYDQKLHLKINEISVPSIGSNEVLIRVKAAGVNPVDLLIANGSVRLIQDYKFPLTLGNELSGVVEAVGNSVKQFKVGDRVMTRLPLSKIGAFAEFVSVDADAIAHMPKHLDFIEAAAVPLTGLTGYQVLHDVLKAKSGEKVFLPGGSGGLGAMLIPLAKQMGLKVVTSGSEGSRERLLAMEVDQFIDYKTQHYGDHLSQLDYVIDTLGVDALAEELRILKPKGKVVSLKGMPNYRFAVESGLPFWKQLLFKIAGGKYDRMAAKQEKTYHFFFVKSNGKQLQAVADLMEINSIRSTIDSVYTFAQVDQALSKVSQGHAQGKVVVTFE